MNYLKSIVTLIALSLIIGCQSPTNSTQNVKIEEVNTPSEKSKVIEKEKTAFEQEIETIEKIVRTEKSLIGEWILQKLVIIQPGKENFEITGTLANQSNINLYHKNTLSGVFVKLMDSEKSANGYWYFDHKTNRISAHLTNLTDEGEEKVVFNCKITDIKDLYAQLEITSKKVNVQKFL